jgi:hypothetical protein
MSGNRIPAGPGIVKPIQDQDNLLNPLSFDAWHRPKRANDRSLFHSRFTFNIPDTNWVLPTTTVGDATVGSVNGALKMTSGTSDGDYSFLTSRRHPAYQPNRGHLYSTALILPDPEAVGFTRRWGLYFEDDTEQSGVLFELRDGVLYGKTITTYDGVKKEVETAIDYTGLALDGGALFDIQFQWRGVGDYFFFINQKLVLTIRNLGTIDSDNKVSVINPSVPARFECKNTGGTGTVELISGCVDISSEGGARPITRPQFLDAPPYLAVAALSYPILIAYVPYTFYGQHNTRDVQVLAASMGMDAQGFFKVILTRDISIFGALTLGDINGEDDFSWISPDQSCIKYYTGAAALDLSDPTKYHIAGGMFIPKSGDDARLSKGDLGDPELFMTHGDYLICMSEKASAGTSVSYGTLFLSEEL